MIISKYSWKYFRIFAKYTLKYFCMDKQIIKNIIIEKQIAIPNYKLVHRDFLFGDKSNYILVGIRRAGKSYLLYQDIQTRLNKGEQSAHDILYINFEDERLSSLKAEELGIILDSYMELYPGKQPFVYLDEIQNIEGWEKFARRLADSQYRVMNCLISFSNKVTNFSIVKT